MKVIIKFKILMIYIDLSNFLKIKSFPRNKFTSFQVSKKNEKLDNEKTAVHTFV